MRKTILAVAVVMFGCSLAFGQAQEKILYSFSGPDGSRPVSKLLIDSTGNLYGTTSEGGTNNGGTVFELSPQPDGTWTETVIYNFCQQQHGTCLDGEFPEAGLIADARGNLYGTTAYGGVCDSGGGCGTVFQLSPPQSGSNIWQETVLYTFCQDAENGCPDGQEPVSKLSFDSEGNLYGTTLHGGDWAGDVFELSPGPNGWSEKILYTFCSVGEFPHCTDGFWPMSGVSFDRSGNLYGTTNTGGSPNSEGFGVLYELSQNQTGWVESVVQRFAFNTGYYPVAEVNFDSEGNIYSTATKGGQLGQGIVFGLSPVGKHRIFSFNRANGSYPDAGVLIDPRNGNLYGTTSAGGVNNNACAGGCGTVYKINGRGETVLYSFFGGMDGAGPMAGLEADKHGHLYGTTSYGGANNLGTVFEIIP